MRQTICAIIGSRPNYIKAAPIIEALKEYFDILVIDSGQHSHNPALSTDILAFCGIVPDVSLDVGSDIFGKPHRIRFDRLRYEIFHALCKFRLSIDYVMVFGDVDTALAGALSALHLEIPVIHYEAGLRSREWDLREEYNRIIIDRLSICHLCTEKSAVENLKNELIEDTVFLVGNTMIDSLAGVCSVLPIVEKEYIAMTIHRSKNVDNIGELENILHSVDAQFKDIEIRFFIHPRTQSAWDKNRSYKIEDVYNIKCFGPIPYEQMIKEIKDAYLVITDSGGIQEEAAWLKKRCITLRDSTERPSTIECGSNFVTHPHYIFDWKNNVKDSKDIKGIPLWDGRASTRIAKILKEKL